MQTLIWPMAQGPRNPRESHNIHATSHVSNGVLRLRSGTPNTQTRVSHRLVYRVVLFIPSSVFLRPSTYSARRLTDTFWRSDVLTAGMEWPASRSAFPIPSPQTRSDKTRPRIVFSLQPSALWPQNLWPPALSPPYAYENARHETSPKDQDIL